MEKEIFEASYQEKLEALKREKILTQIKEKLDREAEREKQKRLETIKVFLIQYKMIFFI